MGLDELVLLHVAAVAGHLHDLELAADVAALVAAFELAAVDEDQRVLYLFDFALLDVARRVFAETQPAAVFLLDVGDVALGKRLAARVNDQGGQLVGEQLLLLQVERVLSAVEELLLDEGLHVHLHEVLET